ncbi:MAG: polysaccharide pyruvyl transferase family protein [Gallionellaceae bacterium]|nr:polysaccharide pyruvyl transferase family protein [Gallionellaceae bacterium]
MHAGLTARDLTAWGGHRVAAITVLARTWGKHRADLVHIGGELLTCTAYEAAVMLQAADTAAAIVARLDAEPAARTAWATGEIGQAARLPYLAAKSLFRNPGRFEYRAVGGVGLDRLDPAARAEALARLAEADRVTVRDRVTQGHLAAAGLPAALEIDPASRVAALFGARVRRHGAAGEPAAMRAASPPGYVAVQLAAEYGDDASLDRLADHLEGGPPARLFRAGAAPWHDDLAVCRRLAGRLRGARVFMSLDLWDICALIAGAAAYCGSSLHGGIVARAFGVPRLPFPLPAAKAAAYWQTWEAD